MAASFLFAKPRSELNTCSPVCLSIASHVHDTRMISAAAQHQPAKSSVGAAGLTRWRSLTQSAARHRAPLPRACIWPCPPSSAGRCPARPPPASVSAQQLHQTHLSRPACGCAQTYLHKILNAKSDATMHCMHDTNIERPVLQRYMRVMIHSFKLQTFGYAVNKMLPLAATTVSA